MEIPAEIVNEAARILQKSHRIDKKYAIEIFFAEAAKDSKFLAVIHEKEAKDFARRKVFKDLIKRCKKRIYYDFRRFSRFDTAMLEKLLRNVEEAAANHGFYSEASMYAHTRILENHMSTSERIGLLRDFYSDIFAVVGWPKVLLDVSAGFNPFSLPWMNINHCLYLATETNQKTMNLLREYFNRVVSRHMDLKGYVFKLDLAASEFPQISFERELEQYVSTFSDVDVAFLMKTLHFVDRLRKGSAKRILNWLQSKYIVVTEPTISLVNRKDIGRRENSWVRRVLSECSMKIIFSKKYPAEILYILAKQ